MITMLQARPQPQTPHNNRTSTTQRARTPQATRTPTTDTATRPITPQEPRPMPGTEARTHRGITTRCVEGLKLTVFTCFVSCFDLKNRSEFHENKVLFLFYL